MTSLEKKKISWAFPPTPAFHITIYSTVSTIDLQVNGFYGAKGISGYIPDSYTYIAKKFCEQRDARGQQDRIDLFEYYRDKWTFHAKGMNTDVVTQHDST